MQKLSVAEPPTLGGTCTITDATDKKIVGHVQIRTSSIIPTEVTVFDAQGRVIYYESFPDWGDMQKRRFIVSKCVQGAFQGAQIEFVGR